jgi:peptidoglycan/xylan/chitin deacetylase (PgdA/CDA1 family)
VPMRLRTIVVAAMAVAALGASLPQPVLASPIAAPAPAQRAGDCPAPTPGTVTAAPGRGRTVALTFDDGPGPATRKILKVLTRYGVHATFFDTGANDARYPGRAKAVVAAGSILGVHSYDHQYPSHVEGGWSRSYLRAQFGRTARLQHRITGQSSCVVRAPGGYSSPALHPVARSLGLTVVGWSVDTLDWRQPGHLSAADVRRIVTNAEAGLRQRHPVILMHAAKASHESEAAVSSFRGNTVAALPAIIRAYQRHGYRFVVLSA